MIRREHECFATTTALDELERSNRQTALITMCTGGGQGIATMLERV